uniref:outer spore coat protein CotE n=1 Tax=Virgibacillus massiliensis TaxID=1462526 RepID=UPI0018E1CACE
NIENKGHKIVAEIVREFIVQVIGDTKIADRVDPKREKFGDDDDHVWDYELTDDELEEVEPDFLHKD